jgi:ATP-binding cassette, subfamily B (MDR/TAP), member 1
LSNADRVYCSAESARQKENGGECLLNAFVLFLLFFHLRSPSSPMARSAAHHANGDNVVSHELEYELDVSPPPSLYSIDDKKQPPTADTHSLPQPQNRLSIHTDISVHDASPPPPPQPSFKLLFSLLSRRQRLSVLLPAVIFSIVSGGVAPFMTLVVGQVFNSFAHFPLSNPSQDARDKLMHDVGIQALELVGLAAGSVILSSITSCFWIWVGEHNAMALGKRVYKSVTGKDMAWFDTKMGSDASNTDSIGAGGMMTQFQRYVFYYHALVRFS